MSLIEHLEKLRHFNRLSDFSSISEAARAMGISQAGLSKSVANLESILDTSLFVRSSKGLLLTPEGEILLKASRKILSDANAAEVTLQRLKASKVPKSVRLGMYDSIAIYFFQDLSKYLKEIYIDVSLSLLVDQSSALADAVVADRIDLAIGVNLVTRRQKGFEYFFLFHDFYSFYISATLQNDLQNQTSLLIFPEASDLNHVTVEEHLSGLTSHVVHRIRNFETLKALVVQGLGIGILPTRVAMPLVQQKLLAPTRIPKAKTLFAQHEIGFIVADKFLARHRDFALDLVRLGQRWVK
jgi:DNA-binding transcriptional LysR family regulator